MFIDYYEDGLVDKNQKNIEDVKVTASNLLTGNILKKYKWLLIKINNHIDRYGLKDVVNQILTKIVNDDFFASMFAMDASKQNMSEESQKKYLSNRGIHVEKLTAGGKKAIRLMNGELITGNDRGSKATKSMDFIYNDELIFAKVTFGAGGGQDNQYRDVLDFLKEANKYDNKYGNRKFTALVDGDYYTEEKLKSLNQFKTKNIRITNSDEF